MHLLILGDALADGATIKWQYHKALEGLTEDEVEKICLEEIKGMEAECMEKNAWQVCHDVASRIDGEPAPCGDMIAYVTQRTGIYASKTSHFKLEQKVITL